MRVFRRGSARPPSTGLLVPALGTVLVTALVLLMAILVPLLGAEDGAAADARLDVTLLGWTVGMARSSLYFVLSLAGGALGGTLHSVASLTAHVAAGDLSRRWTLWYLANPFVGAALAGVFLFVLQAGLGGQAASSSAAGLFGVAAFATLAGLFSRHALTKLKEIFDVVFAGAGAAGVTATTPVAGPPAVLAVTPTPLFADGQDAPVVVSGSHFTSGSEVEVNGTRLQAVTLSPESAEVVVPGSLLTEPATLHVRVRSGQGLWSNEAELEVRP